MVPRSIRNVLERVEALPAAGSGALVVGRTRASRGGAPEPDGILFIEQRRICWTTAAGMGRRFRDILRIHSRVPLVNDEIVELCARCRTEHLPVCETLVREGFLAPGELRAALEQHTAESLLAIAAAHGAGGDWPATWIGRGTRGFDPTYSFSATEILAAVGATLASPMVVPSADSFEQIGATGASAIAFTREGAAELPTIVGATEGGVLRIEDLTELTEWASAALGATAGWSAAVTQAYVRSASAGGAVAWRAGETTFVAVCPGGDTIVRLVALVDALQLPMVLSTNLAVLRRVRLARVASGERRESRQGI